MRPLALLVLAFYCLGQANAVHVYFQSRNFQNVLHWEKVDALGQTVLYSVEYNVYGHSYEKKRECQNITGLSCDLTEETPVGGPYAQYIARVKAGDVEIGHTSRFSPSWHTVLGAPAVTMTLNSSAMTVRVELPKRPNNRSMEEILSSQLVYNITLTNNRSGETITQLYENGSFVVGQLRRDTKYCGSVTYNIKGPSRRPQSEAFTFCEVLPGDVDQRQFLFLLPVGVVLLLLVMIPVLVWHLLTRKKVAQPESLNVPRFYTSFLTPHEEKNISSIRLQAEKHSLVVALPPDTKRGFASGGEGYAPQDHAPQDHAPEAAWTCVTYATQQAASPDDSQGSALSSPTYSVVVRAQVLSHSGDESSPTIEGPPGSHSTFPEPRRPPGPVSHLLVRQSDLDGPQPGPLKLATLQTPEGKLELSFPASAQQAPGDCDPEEGLSERVALLSGQPDVGGDIFLPLLSSLTLWDSDALVEGPEAGVTTTYLSNEVVPSPEPTSYLPDQAHFCPGKLPSIAQSNYTQKCVPAMVPERFAGPGVSLQSSGASPGEGNQQEEEEEEVCRGIFLDGWRVQIQS